MDADVTMVDLTRSMESLIGKVLSLSTLDCQLNLVFVATANRLHGGVNKKCAVIAQLSPATINTGVLLFQVSPEGERILANWMETHRSNANRGTLVLSFILCFICE